MRSQRLTVATERLAAAAAMALASARGWDLGAAAAVEVEAMPREVAMAEEWAAAAAPTAGWAL